MEITLSHSSLNQRLPVRPWCTRDPFTATHEARDPDLAAREGTVEEKSEAGEFMHILLTASDGCPMVTQFVALLIGG